MNLFKLLKFVFIYIHIMLYIAGIDIFISSVGVYGERMTFCLTSFMQGVVKMGVYISFRNWKALVQFHVRFGSDETLLLVVFCQGSVLRVSRRTE